MVLHFKYREAHKAPVRALYRTLLRHCRHLLGYMPMRNVGNLRLDIVARFREGKAQMNSYIVLDMLSKAHLVETQLRSASLGEVGALDGLKQYCIGTHTKRKRARLRWNPPPTGKALQALIEKQRNDSLFAKYLKSQRDRKMIPARSKISSIFKKLVLPQIISKNIAAKESKKRRMLHTPFLPNLAATHGRIAKYYFIRYPGGQNASLGRRISRMWKNGEKWNIKLTRGKTNHFYSQQQDAWESRVNALSKQPIESSDMDGGWAQVSETENARVISQVSNAHNESYKRKLSLQSRIHDIRLKRMDTAQANKRLLDLNFNPRMVKNISKKMKNL